MKIARKSLTKRQLAVLIPVAVLSVGGVAGAALWQYDKNNLSNQELTEAADKTSTIDREQVEGPKGSENSNNDPQPELPQKPPYEEAETDESTDGNPSSPPDGPAPEQPRITRASQSGSTIKVTALFQGVSTGKCELRLSKTGQATITRITNIVTGPSYYACGFSVPRATLPVGGNWQAVVVHRVGSASTASASETFQVN